MRDTWLVRMGVHTTSATAFGFAWALGTSCTAPAFQCQTNDQCVGPGQGICQPQGYCSFPSDDCESGQQFAEDDGPFAGKCVPVDDGTTGGGETTDGGGSGASSTTDEDPGVGPTTGTVADGSSTGAGSDGPGGDTTTDASDSGSGSTGEPVDPDLLLWLQFDEASGVYQDSSQFGLDGTCDPDTCPEVVPGAFGEALRVDGSQYAIWPHASHFEDLSEMTFSAWVRLDAPPTSTGFIAGKPEGTGIYDSFELFFLWFSAEGHAVLRYAVSDGMAHPAEIAPPYPIGEWFNVAGTWDGQTCTLFVEGVARDSEPCPGYAWSDHFVYVGCDSNNGEISSCFDGSVDDVRLYSRVLSEEEMLSLGTSGSI